MTAFRYVIAPAMAVLALPSAASAHELACGATVTTSTKLRADLVGCPGDGLIVGADDVTLDLGRHTLSGAGVGIRVAGHRGVRIRGGTLTRFATGISLEDADQGRVTGVTLRGIAGRGVDVLGGSDGNAFTGLRSTGNRTGIAITASAGNRVRLGTFSGNAATGVLLFGASRTAVDGNTVADNVGQGIAVVEGSSENAVRANRVRGGEAGVIVDTSDRNVLALNRVSGAGDGITVAGAGNTIEGNVVDRSVGGCENCGAWGIGVVSGDGNAIKANVVTRSAGNGIAAHSGWVGFNVALRNGALGIDAVGATDGGGNVAAQNGNREQCAGVRCRWAASPRRGGHRAGRTPPRSAHRSGAGRHGHR
jgi:parallel beta-helix repeat protein